MFSFIRLGVESNDRLFASAGKILTVPMGRQADVEVLTEFAPFFGRLIITADRGKAQCYTLNLKTYLDRATV